MFRNSLILALAGVMLPLASAQAQSLDETVAAALEHSPALAAARARADAAKAGVDEARAQHLPTITAQGQFGYGRINPRGFFGLQADNVTPRVAQVDAELPLLTFGRIGSGLAQAKGGRAIAALQVAATALDIRVRAVQAYTRALTAREQVEEYTRTVAMLAEALRAATLGFKAGGGTSTEVAQARARKAEAQAGLAGAQGQLAGALAQLKSLTGAPVEPTGGLPAPPQVPATRDEATEMALAHNPQVEQAREAAKVAHAAVTGARAEGLPTIGAYAEASSVRDQFFPGYKADSASAGLRAKWTFFSGGRVSAKVSGAEARERAAQADVAEAEQTVGDQAVQAFEGLTAARAVLTASELRASAAQEARRGTGFEVKAGAKPQLALLDAEREDLAAQTARIEAQGRLLVAAYTLRAITGMDD